jgi:predicted small metal-binding protein
MERAVRMEREFVVSGSDLGVAGCDEVFRGPTAGDVVTQVVEHLRSEHKIDMPDPDLILERDLEGGSTPNIVRDVARAVAGRPIDDEAAIIVRRLRDRLNIGVREDDERMRDDLPQA